MKYNSKQARKEFSRWLNWQKTNKN